MKREREKMKKEIDIVLFMSGLDMITAISNKEHLASCCQNLEAN